MSINLNKFTLKSQEALQSAQEIASNFSNQSIEPEHLFAALIQDKESLVGSIILKLGLSKDTMMIRVGELLEKIPKVTGAGLGQQSVSRELSEVL